MPSPTEDADAIRARMAQIRSEMHRDVKGVVEVASLATDWRSYIRARPWAAIGIAFAAGYLVVPKRRAPEIVKVVSAAAEPVMQSVAPSRPAVKKRFGAVRWVLGAVGPLALQAAQSYAAQYLENYLANMTTGSGPVPDPPRPPRANGESSPEPRRWNVPR